MPFIGQAQLTMTTPNAPTKQTTVIIKLTPKEGYDLIQKNKNNPNFVILDIRTPEEFESGYIEGAININYHSDTFVEDLDKLDKNKTYFVYCRTGRRSGDAVGIMTKQGFREIYRINGDIVKWKAAGLPVVKAVK
jgi:rhodanese-related sulfurtransferase